MNYEDRARLFTVIGYIAILIAIIAILSILIGFVNGAGASTTANTKNVTISVHKGEMVYCSYGNPARPTAVCNSIKLTDSFRLVSRFLEILEYGPTLEK